MSNRPFILVLAGVNGAGKSSVLGSNLLTANIEFFNPNTFARALLASNSSYTQKEANIAAWSYGVNKLQEAIDTGISYAFETTLGGNTICSMLLTASNTHNVKIMYCGLNSPEAHIARVAFRITQGGHEIPEAKIRERWETSRVNLVKLIPHVTDLKLFDNSATVTLDADIPEPIKLLEIRNKELLHPALDDIQNIEAINDWAKPIVMAAFEWLRSKG